MRLPRSVAPRRRPGLRDASPPAFSRSGSAAFDHGRVVLPGDDLEYEATERTTGDCPLDAVVRCTLGEGPVAISIATRAEA